MRSEIITGGEDLCYGLLGYHTIYCGSGYQRFGGTHRFHPHFYFEDGGSMLLRNVGNYQSDYTLS
jgi:hypothetical protein